MMKKTGKNLRSIHFGYTGAGIALALLLVACGTNSGKRTVRTSDSSTQAPTRHPAPPVAEQGEQHSEDPDEYTVVFARHVVFHERQGIELKAEWLEGRMYPTRPGVDPSLDDPDSFKIEIEEGKTSLNLQQLSDLLMTGVFKNSKLKKVRLAEHGPREIEIRGTLHKLIALPVQVIGELGATPDGRISIRIESIKVLKVPLKGMLHAMHLDAADLLNARKSEGVQARGDAVFLRTDKLLPAPRKLGVVTDVHFNSQGELEEDYGTHNGEQSALPHSRSDDELRNFIRLTGGTISFGKLTMRKTDLILIDTSPGDWFGFDLEHYAEQLAAGDMHMTPSGGLKVWIPDSAKLKHRT